MKPVTCFRLFRQHLFYLKLNFVRSGRNAKSRSFFAGSGEELKHVKTKELAMLSLWPELSFAPGCIFGLELAFSEW